MRFILHYGFHFLVPVGIAKAYDHKHWKQVYLIFLASMLIDLDHLLSHPIYDPQRLSIGHHLLHSYPAIALYTLGLFWRPLRILSFALIFHMFTDLLDYTLLLLGLA